VLSNTFRAGSSNIPYAYPTGYTANKFWEESTCNPNITYLDWDYLTNPYVGTGNMATPAPSLPPGISYSDAQYGPSSHHSGVTNHLLADGSVQSISNDIDVAAYMFLITRNNGDPFPDFQ
jgi:hypothetical protein